MRRWAGRTGAAAVPAVMEIIAGFIFFNLKYLVKFAVLILK
jgi:hypothetical protein